MTYQLQSLAVLYSTSQYTAYFEFGLPARLPTNVIWNLPGSSLEIKR